MTRPHAPLGAPLVMFTGTSPWVQMLSYWIDPTSGIEVAIFDQLDEAVVWPTELPAPRAALET